MKLTDEQIDALEITNDPVISRMRFGSRYDAIFERLKVGQALKVPSAATSSVSDSLDRWIRRNGKTDLTTRRVSDYGDGMGRVWLVRKERQRGATVESSDGAKKKRAAQAREVGTVWHGAKTGPWDGMG